MDNNQLNIGESTRLNDDVAGVSATVTDDNDNEVVEEEEVKKLEEEVLELVKRVEASRSTLPQHLKSSLSSLLSLQRSSFSLLSHDDSSEPPGPSCAPHTDPGSSHGNSSTDVINIDGEENPDEVKLLRDKISSNISAIPKVLKRMNECISRIDKLDSSNDTIHPLFKRRKS